MKETELQLPGLEGLFAFHFYDFPARKLCLLPLHYLNGTTTKNHLLLPLPILLISLCRWFRTSSFLDSFSNHSSVLCQFIVAHVDFMTLTLIDYICFSHSRDRATIVGGWMDGWNDGFIALQTGDGINSTCYWLQGNEIWVCRQLRINCWDLSVLPIKSCMNRFWMKDRSFTIENHNSLAISILIKF